MEKRKQTPWVGGALKPRPLHVVSKPRPLQLRQLHSGSCPGEPDLGSSELPQGWPFPQAPCRHLPETPVTLLVSLSLTGDPEGPLWLPAVPFPAVLQAQAVCLPLP